MVAGTSIGAGIWAIPAVTSELGFTSSCVCLIVAWLVMFLSAKMFQCVHGFLPRESHFLGMVSWTLGAKARAVCWVVYLGLLYMLMAAYMAGMSSVLAKWTGINVITCLIILVVVAIIFFTNIHVTQQVSWWLMTGLVCSLFFLLMFMGGHLHPVHLVSSDWHVSSSVFSIILTSFGYQIILPSLREFINDDQKLSKVILWGSLVPLVVYIIWEAWMFMAFPLTGNLSLSQVLTAGNPNVVIPQMLVDITQNQKIRLFAEVFSFFTIATSFIGVAQSLVDFLKEGLSFVQHQGCRQWCASICSYVLPCLFVVFYPRGFIMALDYAGILVAILLLAFPVMMFWSLVRQGHMPVDSASGLLIGSPFVMGSAVLLFFMSL